MPPTERAPPNFLLPAAGLLAFAAFVALALADRATYAWLIDLWSFHPAPMTFVDTEGPLAWIRCWRMGVDIYAGTPCEVLHIPMNYSPALLRVPWPWVAPEDVVPTAIALDVLFLLSLAVLPRARTRGGALVLLLGLFSPFCVFALERANFDLLMFIAAAVLVLCLERGLALRLLGTAAIVAVGLLKLYPWALLLFLLRERRTVLLLASLAFAAILVAYVAAFHAELPRMLANLPRPIMFDDSFGASQLPIGLTFIIHRLRGPAEIPQATDVLVQALSTAALYAACAVGALRIGTSERFARDFATLTRRESLCLAVGAILICGGFFTGVSIGYRATFLLFALPGLLALGRNARPAVAAALLVMWSLPPQRLIALGFGRFWESDAPTMPLLPSLPGIAWWLLREAAWWWLITVLLAVVLRTVLDSRTWVELFHGRASALG